MGLKRQKKFIVSNVYRDWKYVNQANQDSGTIAAQLSRWETFLQQWENAIASESEIHVLGDLNLSFLDFNNKALQLTPTQLAFVLLLLPYLIALYHMASHNLLPM